MKHFTGIHDVGDWQALVKAGLEAKKAPFSAKNKGENKAMCLIFLNPSLRTRLSTQRAAIHLGLETVIFDVGQGGWQLEFDDGVVMNGDKPEHIREAAAVIGAYYEVIGIRAFARLQDKDEDYAEKVLGQFIKHAGRPILNLESPTRHPLQSLTDLMTIEEHKKAEKPKVVLTWAPHPKALPHAVANSLLEWLRQTPYEVVLTHPPGYELDASFVGDVKVEENQEKAFENADFIYAKNWSSVTEYGKVLTTDPDWMVTQEKMELTNEAYFMHCLPVRRNVVVEDAVIDSPQSLVIRQATNRIYAAQAALSYLLDLY